MTGEDLIWLCTAEKIVFKNTQPLPTWLCFGA